MPNTSKRSNQVNSARTPWNKGKKGVQVVSEITRKLLSDRAKGNKNRVGAKPWNKGLKCPQLSGEKHPKWNGGVSRDRHGGTEYQQWRSDIFVRDNWTCQTCHRRGNLYLEAHHIKSWSKYPDLRYELTNGVTLCVDCHRLTFNYKGNQQ